MKRVIVSVLLFFAVGAVVAQNIQLHYDLGKDRNYLTTTVEKFNPDKYGSTFFFVDFNYDKHGATEAYWEVARELKNWEGPISAHIEYNGGLNKLMQFNNCYLLGATYSYNASDFSKGASFTAMYKNIQGNSSPHNFQLTGCLVHEHARWQSVVHWFCRFLERKAYRFERWICFQFSGRRSSYSSLNHNCGTISTKLLGGYRN
jgi:hypothetical protein